MIDKLFNLCVGIMIEAGHFLGISYQAVNILLFVILQPLLILVFYLLYRKYKRKYELLKNKKYLLLLLFLVLSYNQYAQKVSYERVVTDGSDESDYEECIFAIIDGERIKLPLEGISCPHVEHQGDYNFDGYTDLLIRNDCGGSCCAGTYLFVFYDGKGFYQTKEVGYDWNSAEISRSKNGKYRFVIENRPAGWEQTAMCEDVVETYVVKGYRAIKIKEVRDRVIKSNIEIRSAIFQKKGVDKYKNQTLCFDLDADSKKDSIICKYWDRWGRMFWKIHFADGKKIGGNKLGYPKRIGVLTTKTNGVYDLVLECDDILKWNGQTYELKKKK